LANLAADGIKLATAFGLVAAVAVPIALGLTALLKSRNRAVCPPWRAPGSRYPGWLVLMAMIGVQHVLPSFLVSIAQRFHLLDFLADAAALRGMYARVALVPVVLVAGWWVQSRVLEQSIDFGRMADELPRWIVLAVACWLTFGTATYGLNWLVSFAYEWLKWPLIEHPIARVGTQDGTGGVLIALSACLAAPILEELLFRGLLLSWLHGPRHRVWYAHAVTLLLTGMIAFGPTRSTGPIAFAVLLSLGQLALEWSRYKTLRVMWASSAPFALMHAAIWPSPIPLFVLSLGLGYLAMRTRSWLPSALAHALFNAASLVFLLLPG